MTPSEQLRQDIQKQIEIGLKYMFKECNGKPEIWVKRGSDVIMQIIEDEKKAAVEEAVPIFLKHLAGCEYIEVTTDDYESEGRKLARAIYAELFPDKP